MKKKKLTKAYVILYIYNYYNIYNDIFCLDWFYDIPYFQYCDHKELRMIHLNNTVKKFKKNEIIYKEGDRSNYIYIIKEGEVMLTKEYQKGVKCELETPKIFIKKIKKNYNK